MNAISQEVENYRKSLYAIQDQFLNRWSPRAFSSQPVDEQVLMGLFEAASWAPSGGNEQPWRYIVAQTAEQLSTFHSFISPSNLEWCNKAPVLALLVSKTTRDNGKPNASHSFDAGASWSYLALEAIHRGLHTHAIAGFDKAQAKEVLHIPEEYKPEVIVVIGYRTDSSVLSEQRQAAEKPNARKPLSQLVMNGVFQTNE